MTRSQLISIFLALVLVAVAAAYGGQKWTEAALRDSGNEQNQVLYQNNLDACERGNRLREESNMRIPVHELENDVLIKFLAAAQKAREAAFEKDGRESDRKAAEQYGSYIRDLQEGIKFNADRIINCKAVIKKPERL